MGSDIGYIIQWWSVFLLLGGIFLPLSFFIFPAFVDRGYIFAKVIGSIFLTYAVLLIGVLKLAPFSIYAIVGILVIFLMLD